MIENFFEDEDEDLTLTETLRRREARRKKHDALVAFSKTQTPLHDKLQEQIATVGATWSEHPQNPLMPDQLGGSVGGGGVTLPLEYTQALTVPSPTGEVPNPRGIFGDFNDEQHRREQQDYFLNNEVMYDSEGNPHGSGDFDIYAESETQRLENHFQHGRRFVGGASGMWKNMMAGWTRMTVGDEEADKMLMPSSSEIQKAENDERFKMMTEIFFPEKRERIREEQEKGFDILGTGVDSLEFSEGAGNVAGMIAGTTVGSMFGPKGTYLALTGMVVGQNYEGNYQRSLQERMDKTLEEMKASGMSPLSPEFQKAFQDKLPKLKEEANSDALGNLWTAVPEVALEAVFLKGAGKLLRGQGTIVQRIGNISMGTLAEGASEGLSLALQNWMVQRNIDPNQKVNEGVLHDFMLGLLLGGATNVGAIAGNQAGVGDLSALMDVQKFKQDLLDRAKKDAKNGDAKAQKFLEDYESAVETIVAQSKEDGEVHSLSSRGQTVDSDSLLSRDAILNEASEVVGKDSDLDIHLIETIGDIDQVSDGLSSQLEGVDGVEGLYLSKSKKVVLVRDQLNDLSDVNRVVRHEAIGHLGTEMVAGNLQDLFYQQVGMDFVDTDIGRDVLKNYSTDANFDVVTLGKEIVARVAENPESAGTNLKRSIVNSFKRLTGKQPSNPESDRRILKSISLASEFVNNPRLKAQLEKTEILKQGKEETANLSKKGEVDHGVLGNVEDGEILYTESGDLGFLAHREPISGPTRGNPWRFNEEKKTVYYWQGKPSEIDRDTVEIALDKKGYDTRNLRHMHLDANSPNFAKHYENAHTFPLKGDPPRMSDMSFSKKARKIGVPDDFRAEAERYTKGKPGQLVPVDLEVDALGSEFYGVVDASVYHPETGEQLVPTSGKEKKYFGVTKYEDPDSTSSSVDKWGFPRQFVWAFQPLDNAYGVIESDTKDFEEALSWAESEDLDRRIDMVEEDPSLDSVLFSKKIGAQIPAVQSAYYAMKSGQISKHDYNHAINRLAPVLPYDRVPKPATVEEMSVALPANKGQNIGRESEFTPGQRVGIRLDIDAYTYHGVWVPTKHGKSNRTGKIITSHESVAMLTNADLSASERTGELIMEGRNKTSYAQIKGEYVPIKEEDAVRIAEQALKDPAWTQIGFDPRRHSYFYNRKNHGQPVLHADEVIQVGPLVLGKNATFGSNETVSFSKKAKVQAELKKGMTRDKDGNIFYKGVPPNKWTPEIFKEVGDLYGIKNFGGLSKVQTITDPESGKPIKIPGGLNGKFTYYDMLWMKNNQPDLNEVSEGLHAKITKKLAESLTPEKLDPVDHFNRLAFGFLSPNAPLLPNEFGLARLFARDKADIQKIADLSKTYPSDAPLNVEHEVEVARLSQTDGKSKAKERDRVWSMVDNAYRDIGIPFDKPTDMDSVAHWDVGGKSVVMFKEKPDGLKLVVAGHDGTSEGKKELMRRVRSYLTEPGHFAELSDGMMQFAEGEKLAKIPSDKAGELLGKEVTINDKFFYTRRINALQKDKTKVLYGRPWNRTQKKQNLPYPQVPTTRTSSQTDARTHSSKPSKILVGLTKREKDKASKKLNEERSIWNKKAKALFDIGAKGDGGLGIGLTQDFNRLGNFARLYLKDPDFFVKKADESWSFFVDRVASQTKGFGTKTASFGGVWQDPFNAMISAIDRHMARGFAEAIMESKDLKNEFSDTIVTKYNAELRKSKKAFDKHKGRLKQIKATHKANLKNAKTDAQKKQADNFKDYEEKIAKDNWNEALEESVDPSMREVKTLDGVMAQAKRMGADKIKTALGNATFELMSARTAKFKGKEGKVNKNLAEEWKNFEGFIEEPSALKLMTNAYSKALEVNEQKANELGIPVFPAQWTLWDRIRQRIEPHEVMFPGLNKLPRMGREQIAESYLAQSKAGYNIAPQPIEPTGGKPEEMVYFSKKEGSQGKITGESKLVTRIFMDPDFSDQVKGELNGTYEIQGHAEVMESLKPWFDRFRGRSSDGRTKVERMANDLLTPGKSGLSPEQNMLASQLIAKHLSKAGDALRERTEKKQPGQLKLEGIAETNKYDDLAIQLVMQTAETARTYGRAISILQELGNLNATSLVNFTRNQIGKTTEARVNRKLPELSDQVINELNELIRSAREAGFNQMSIEFLRKKSPNLLKILEERHAPSLWGAYKKEAVSKLHQRLVDKLHQDAKQGKGTAPLARFTNELITEIGRRTGLNQQGNKGKPRSRGEVLRDALLNSEKYAEVWKDLAEKALNDPDITQEQRAELQEYFGKIPTDPSGKLMDSSISERMKVLDVKVSKLVREHLDSQNSTRKDLIDSLMSELDLPAPIAERVAFGMTDLFNKKMKAERDTQLKKFKEKDSVKRITKKAKGFEQRVIELSNLGAFSREDLFASLAKSLGIKGGFDRAFATQVTKLANEIQTTPEGFQRINKTQDLLNAIQNKAGDGVFALMLAIRIANLVSGPSTQVINLTGNLATAIPMQLGNLARGGRTSPRLAYEMAVNMLHGLTKGWAEARSIMVTGRGRAGFEMDKYSFDPILERVNMRGGKLNPYNYLKYVHRFMSSLDALFRFSNIEGKASFLAHMEGKNMGKSGKELTAYVMEALGNTESMRQASEAQATKEGLTGLNHKRRVNELMESNRSPEIKTESEQFGLRTTYQNKPEGIVGVLAHLVAQGAHPRQMPGDDVLPGRQFVSGVTQFFIPFIRVVANVQNMVFDFTPGIGATRAEWHKRWGGHKVTKGEKMTDEAYKDMHMRHLIGTALCSSLAYLFFREEEDEEDRMFDITGPGPSNYQKKKTLVQNGWKPYTIRMFGTDIGYKETPFGGFLAFMGGIKDAQKYNDEQPTTANLTLAGTLAFAKLMKDQAFFKGAKDFMDIFQADDLSIARLKKLVKQGPSQFVVPNLFYQVDAMMSNTRYSEGTLESFMGVHLLPQVPFARQMGMPDLDILGQKAPRYTNDFPMNLFSRVIDDAPEPSLMDQVIKQKIIPQLPNRNTKIRENDDELSDMHRAQDLYLYTHKRGQLVRAYLHMRNQGGETKRGEPIVPLGDLPQEKAQDVWDNVWRKSGERAKKYIKRIPREKMVMELKRLKRVIEGPQQ